MQRYLVFGAARSGIAAARLLRSKEFPVTVVDEKPESAFEDVIPELKRLGVNYHFGKVASAVLLDGIEAIVLSPGIPLIHPLVVAAEERGVEVIGELELGFRYADAPIAAITGTNGKTTTVHLAADILRAGGFHAAAVGNVGTPICDAVMNPEMKRLDSCLVVEVSSFQLETVKAFHPQVAALLNLSPDHLARHGTMEIYRDLKYCITENQTPEDFLILNRDDAWSSALADKTRARVLWFSTRGELPYGAYLNSETLRLRLDEDVTFLSCSEISIPGLHNLENILAASLVGIAFGIMPDMIADAVRKFSGVEHRIEFVARPGGVDFFNDSKATNLDSVEKALLSFSKPVILIAGGRDKGDDYNRLNSLISARVKHLVVMGEAAPLMRKAWARIVPTTDAGTMRKAVFKAYEQAAPGDIVLLSPGCSSFDAFKDFEERGRVFKAEVGKLANNLVKV